MLVWIPWVWIKRIALALLILVAGVLLTGYVVLRPKPILPAEPYFERWKAIVDEAYPGRDWSQTPLLKDVLSDLNERADRVLVETLLPETAECEEHERISLAHTALDRLREGEWGHPSHAYGVRLVHALRPLLDEATAPIKYQHIDVENVSAQHVSETLVFRTVDTNVLTYSGWGSGSWTYWSIADLRVAAVENDFDRVLSITIAWIENSRQQVAAPTGLVGTFAMNRRDWVISECLYLAAEGYLDAPTMLALADLLEDPLPWHDWPAHARRWRLYEEVVIRDVAKRTSEASWHQIIESLFVAPSWGSGRKPRWRDRILTNAGAIKELRSFHEILDKDWTTPLGDPVPNDPVAQQYRDLLSPTIEDIRHSRASTRKLAMFSDMTAHATAAALRVCAYRAEHGHWPDQLTDAMTPEQTICPYHGGSYLYTPLPEENTFELRLPDDRQRFVEIWGLVDLDAAWGSYPGHNVVRKREPMDERMASRLLEKLGQPATYKPSMPVN